ncbi:Lrp/AsnC family transcriptional regulator [uncultured Desulfobacter sp.]|uniref:Lrp/AsnC family transcriptional regulator n=1 Tax=uncultured Desulfobacter sp. TaxID=240139 RepID=UPI0029F53FA1|nr:Lrp/AsnC family transcriptional regulator [uncultured Desulfobacter sp.]
MKNAKPLDRIDREIIKLLQKDGRISNTDMAKAIDVSEATVRTRLSRLINDEIIQIVAVSNPLKLGFNVVGHLRVHVEIGRIDQVAAQLKEIHALWFIVSTSGASTGIDAEFNVESMADLNELVLNQVGKISGVTSVETTLTLDFVKRRYNWGTGFDD